MVVQSMERGVDVSSCGAFQSLLRRGICRTCGTYVCYRIFSNYMRNNLDEGEDTCGHSLGRSPLVVRRGVFPFFVFRGRPPAYFYDPLPPYCAGGLTGKSLPRASTPRVALCQCSCGLGCSRSSQGRALHAGVLNSPCDPPLIVIVGLLEI